MEKEDKIIKALLSEEFIEKAPEGFTDSVMQSIEASEAKAREEVKSNNWLYGFVFAAPILLALGVISVIDSSFISSYYLLFSGYFSGFFSQVTAVFANTSITGSFILSGNAMLMGIFSIMIVLLIFDGFVLRKQRHMNSFAWTF
jgi:uncharacterized membrane protein